MPGEIGKQIQQNVFEGRQNSKKIALISDLPLWVKNAIARMHLDDLTVPEVAKQMGKNRETLKAYMQSPAAREWAKGIEAAANDPREFTRLTMESMTHKMVQDNLFALELAKEKGDHNAVRLITQWWIERPELLGAVSREQSPTIVINLTGQASLEPKMVQSSHAEAKVEGDGVEAEWEES